MTPALQTFATRDLLYAAAAAQIAEALQRGQAGRGEACAALSGGTTPEPAYALLSPKPADWAKTTFALVDERFVPADNPASNEAMVRRALRKPLERGATLAPLYAPGTLEDAAAQADVRYRALHVDIALLGMGGDGHTASWFPGADALGAALDPANPLSVMAIRAAEPAGSAERLTMTFSALARADRLLLLITGEDKRAVLEQAAARALPVSALFALGDKLDVFWAA